MRKGESGQAIALYAITLLALALITMFTISVGTRVREKLKVQATADSAAYGLAVSQARTMNVMAWANRAIVSEYVSALSVVGHESYLNYWEGTLKEQADQMSGPIGAYGAQCALCIPPSPPPCACQACISAAKASKIKDMWNKQYQDVHKIWHVNGKSLHDALHMLEVQYVQGAASNYKAGKAAYDDYIKLSKGPFADAMAKSVDDRMYAVGPDRSAGGSDPANEQSFTRAVEVDPAAEDWDSYTEILTGTRTDWILKHSNFVPGMPWTQGFQKQMQIAQGCEGTAISPMPSNSGGSMVDQYLGVSDVVAVNLGHDHQYQKGWAKGEGGRRALTAINKGGTHVLMICEACIPVSTGSSSQSYEDNARLDGAKNGCNKSFHRAFDGFSDGDSASGMAHIWTSANGIDNPAGDCSDQGITAGGFFRFKLDGDTNMGTSEAQKSLWNQPYTFATVELDINKHGLFPWDLSFGHVGGSLLTVDSSADAHGQTNQVDSTGDHQGVAGRGYNATVWPTLGGFGTGLTYYHNPKHWAEIPNLWNPFWRAKLEDPTESQGASGEGKDKPPTAKANFQDDDAQVAQAMGIE